MSIEQRLTLRLMKYWEMIRRDQAMPEIQKLNTGVIDDLWPQCLLFSIQPGDGDHKAYKYEYMGIRIVEAYGQDMTARTVDDRMGKFPGGFVVGHLGRVMEKKAPVQDEGHFLNDEGKMIKYRACFLPFGQEEKGVTHIAVGLTFRQF